MKTLLALIVAASILVAVPAWSASLVCDPQTGVTHYNLDVDGTVTQNISAEADGSVLHNVDYLPQGQHIFKLQAVGAGGWPSDWSSPLDATKPGNPLNARIINP